MTTFSKRELIELAGAVSIVASLIFVGFQLYLDRNVAMANAYSIVVEGRKIHHAARLDSDSYSRMFTTRWENGYRPEWWEHYLELVGSPEFDDADEIMARETEVILMLLEMDNIYYQYQSGLLPEPYWIGTRDSLVYNLHDPFYRAVALRTGVLLRGLIQELTDELDGANGT